METVVLSVVLLLLHCAGTAGGSVRLATPLNNGEEELVSNLVVRVQRDRPECLLLLCGDWDTFPAGFVQPLIGLHSNGSTVAIVRWVTRPHVAHPNNGGGHEYWFSWLHRPTARRLHNCATFLFSFNNQDSFQPLVQHTASQILLETSKDRFILWSRDGRVDRALLHPITQLLLFQIGLEYHNQSLKVFSNCHFCDKGNPKVIEVARFEVNCEISIRDLFTDFSTNLHGKSINGTFAFDIEKEEMRYMIDNLVPMFGSLVYFLVLGDKLNFDWSISAAG